ncbi:hypothetical protein GLYMA_09G236400v4 [Glycine max]|uniref:Uncharacterized protein n=1 Tax=Glycine max TaxID=3847 RepID=K7LFQ4_SOYBN|nr:hypothetical protein GYH30_025977 [Glycine max]KRH40074.1 hypothetical protein GLYMA_09G236400v4 [Glycine max]
MENQSPSLKTAEVDVPLHLIGFEIQDLSPQRVSGHLSVTQKCCRLISTLLISYNTQKCTFYLFNLHL